MTKTTLQHSRRITFSSRQIYWFKKQTRTILLVAFVIAFLTLFTFYDVPRHESSIAVGELPSLILVQQLSQEDSVPDNNRIFFHETSGRRFITARQSCAVESAAKFNPQRRIQLYLHTDGLSKGGMESLSVLRQYSNIAISILNREKEENYFANTPLHSWYKEGHWQNSTFRSGHLSDYVRFVSAWKGGGLYLDIDFVSNKPLQADSPTFRNFFSVLERAHVFLSNGVFQLDRGHWLLDAVLQEMAQIPYNSSSWSVHGPLLLSRMMKDVCNLNLPNLHVLPSCNVSVLPHQYFFPVDYQQWDAYFRNVDAYDASDLAELMGRMGESHAIHVWNHLSCQNQTTNEQPIKKRRRKHRTVYDILAAKNCPLTYAKARKLNYATRISRDDIFDLHLQPCSF